jgi:hypothetical protein
MSKFYFYKCFGLVFKSPIPFPELLISKDYNSDITVRFDIAEKFPKGKLNENSNIFKQSAQDISFIFENKPLFRVRNSKEIIINSSYEINDILLRTLILGQGMGILLNQKGYLILHGSAVNIGNKAIAFLGDCGEGKSTTAAALNIKGHSLISDDVLVVNFDEDKPKLLPSFPRIKLWDDVIDSVVKSEELLLQIHPKFKKYSYNTDKTFCETPILLKTIYIIEKGERNSINFLKPQDALMKLIKNAYMFNLFDESEKHQNLIQCAKLASNITVKRLIRSHSLDKIDELTNTIEKDV